MELAPGTILLGKYRIDELIGAGGMGSVVRASHLYLQEPVAIKILLPQMVESEQTVQRFLREAQAAVKLKSEHSARVMDVGTTPDGAPFMVMEYLEGNDLNQILRHHGPQLPPVACDLMLQACTGIAEAHALGIIHRDIKPSNFFITRRPDGSMLLKILDFGISKTPVGYSDLTGTQTVIGTPSYMAPEQMKSGRAADPRSDIWSIGVVMYQLLTGRTPFTGESYADLVLKVGLEPPEPLAVPLNEALVAALRASGVAVALGLRRRVSGDGHLKLGLTADASAPSLHVQLGAEAPAGPEVKLTATLGFDRARRAVSYDFDAHFARLSPLRPLLTGMRSLLGFELGGLGLSLGGRGTVAGLVDKVSPGGIPSFTTRPLALLGIDGSLELRATGLRWTDGNRAVQSPALTLLVGLRTDGNRRIVRGDLSFPELHVALAHHQLDFTRVHDLLNLTVTGDLAQGEGELAHELSLGSLRQSFAPGYAVGDVKLVLQARRSREGVVRISSLQLLNPASGTTLKLRGGLELGDERRSLSLRGTLEQNLAQLWNLPAEYTGQGTASLSLRLESGNLSLFHALAGLRVTDGTVRLPSRGLAVESFDGEVPISVDLLLDRRGVRLLRDAMRNAYAELRFSDQHPLLSRRSFISVARLKTPLLTVGPIAGNLQIENNVVALSQLEMGLLEGRLTGQCLLDWGEKDAAIQLHLRASNLKGSTGERFDGNTAVVISARERSIDGRAEILHIGRRHLLALLDLHDPHHADAAVNRVRSALSLGYPDRVRLSFDHGFAAARITLGGLASVVRINELRGIPTGPIIDRVLARPAEPENKGP